MGVSQGGGVRLRSFADTCTIACGRGRPFAYPGHTLLPWGIERICHSIDWVPHEEREHSALIYSKWTCELEDAGRHL